MQIIVKNIGGTVSEPYLLLKYLSLMKIMYIVEDFAENGGVERIVSQKANTFATDYRHDVTIVSVYDDPRPVLYDIDKSVEFLRLNVPFAVKGKGRIVTLASRIWCLARAVHRLNRAVKTINPDIIFFTTTLGALLLPWCRTRARRVYESHLARRFTPFNLLLGLTERKADAVVCLTEGDAAEFKAARRVFVIPNFIKQPGAYVTNYSVKNAIAVGRLEHQKGFDILIGCWKVVAQDHPDWHLDIYGIGSRHDCLQAQIDKLGLSDKITLCGRSNNIMDLYPKYSMHVMTSRYEGLPMTLIEAQACGLPSVVTDFQFGASDIITDGYNGRIVPQGDNVALADAIGKMMSSESMRRAYGSNAVETAKAYYKDNIFGKWNELIKPYTSQHP